MTLLKRLSPAIDISDESQTRGVKVMLLRMDLDDIRKAEEDPNNTNNYADIKNNTYFLIDHYQNGGNLPPPTGMRWGADGKFLDGGEEWPHPFDVLTHTSDTVCEPPHP